MTDHRPRYLVSVDIELRAYTPRDAVNRTHLILEQLAGRHEIVRGYVSDDEPEQIAPTRKESAE